MTLTLIHVRRLANIIIICNLLSTWNFNPQYIRHAIGNKNACMCTVYAPIKRQMRIPITLFFISPPLAHSICFFLILIHINSFSLSPRWFALILPISYFFISARLPYVCATFTIFKTLTLFNAYLDYYDWNEPSTKREWVMRILMQKRMDTACEIIWAMARIIRNHTQAQTHQRMVDIIFIDLWLLFFFVGWFVWFGCHL